MSESDSESSSSSSSEGEEEVVETKKGAKGKGKGKPAAKRKKKAAADDEPKVKRPLSAYMFYSKEQRPVLKANNKELTFGEIGKLVGQNWKNLSDEERKPYLDQTEADKGRYEKEKGDLPASSKQAQSTSKKKSLGPKKPLTSYMFYMQETRQAVMDENPDFKFAEIGKEVGRRWKTLSNDEKSKFLELADKAKESYQEEKETWERDFPEQVAEMKQQRKTGGKTKAAKAPAKKKQKTAVASASGSSSSSDSESSSDNE